MSAFSVERLRLVVPGRAGPPCRRPSVARPLREKFLKGPLAMGWLHRAGALPGKALAVAVELCHLAGLNKAAQVKLNLSAFEARGISRYAAARGLAALEGADLVQSVRAPGSTPLVTVVGALLGHGGGP